MRARERDVPGGDGHRARRHEPARTARPDRGQHRGHLCRDGFIVVKDAEFAKLEQPDDRDDVRAQRSPRRHRRDRASRRSGLFGMPTLYTTFSRATQYIPSPRFTISYRPRRAGEPRGDPATSRRRSRGSATSRVTEQEFVDEIADFYMYHTGLGTNILLMTVISFIVGLSISGQTFYSFIAREPRAVRRAQGDRRQGPRARRDDPVPGRLTALAGYGLGVGLCAALIALAKLRLPDYASIITFSNLLLRARDGARDRRVLELPRRPPRAADRAVRHLPG